MEHIEEAGVHSGDSSCCLPPHSISQKIIDEVTRQTKALGMALNVRGLMNIQFALQGETLYVLEVNPRASRTVPFVSKATGVPLAKVAARIMAGKTLDELGMESIRQPATFKAVKEAVFPFVKFRGVDPLLSPEMKSTGEVMGIAPTFPAAFAKAQLGGGSKLPDRGVAFVSVREADKPRVVELASRLIQAGFEIMATEGTGKVLDEAGLANTKVAKVTDGVRPHIVDKLLSDAIDFVVNTTEGERTIADSKSIRQATLDRGIVYFTTMAGALAAAESMVDGSDVTAVKSIQDYHKDEVA